MPESVSLAGRFLLAMPGMGDPRFRRSVNAMMIHDKQGALGIGLGNPCEGLGFHTVLEDLDIDPGHAPDCFVLNGGPVEPDHGFVLHSTEWQSDETIIAGNLCGLTASMEILRAIAEGVALDLSNEAAAEASARALKARLLEMQGNASNANGGATADAFMQYDEKTEKYRVMVVRRQHGNQRLSHIDADFVAGADYAALAQTAQTFQGLIGEGAKVRRGTGDKLREQPVSDFHAAMTWLLSEAERGVSRQRYKGLGEMNPEQLWETTMDVTQRRLLRVQIEDAIAADQIFTTLMGDDVEPRRNFIETNALVARNIDV